MMLSLVGVLELVFVKSSVTCPGSASVAFPEPSHRTSCEAYV